MIVKIKFKNFISLSSLVIGINSFSLIGCADKNPTINQPTSAEQTHITSLLDLGSTTFTIDGFSYTNINNFDPKLMAIDAPALSEYVKQCDGTLLISIQNIDLTNKTFSVLFDLRNVNPSDSAIDTKLSFTYDGKLVKTNDITFSITLQNSANEIFFPEKKLYEFNYRSGVLEGVVSGFTYKGINEINKLSVVVNCESLSFPLLCKITEISESNKQFSISFRAYDIPNYAKINLACSLEFYLDGKKIKSEESKIILSLEPDMSHGDFRVATWSNIGTICRTQGLKGLQDTFGLTSFVGIKREVNVSDVQHYVRVVAQDQEELLNQSTPEGKCAALTFMFEDAITTTEEGTKETSVMVTHNFDDKNNIYRSSTSDSAISLWLNNEFINNYMPYDLAGYIPTVKKTTIISTVQEAYQSQEKIWLPSLSEVGGVARSEEKHLSEEGKCYEYFNNINSNSEIDIRNRRHVGGTEKEFVWLRTGWVGDSTVSYCLYGGAIVSYNYFCKVSNLNGVSPCFSL